jgi:predicted RNase H-like nuclease (RuvC/YqgF family)
MVDLSIPEAVKAGFASRASIYRLIKEGSLSSRKTQDGRTLIEVSELIRVFGEPESKKEAYETNVEGMRQPAIGVESVLLKQRLETLERDNARLEMSLKEAKEREQWLKDQVDRQQTLLLETTKTAEKRGFFGWFK